MAERETATGDLGLIQGFVNTLDVLPGTEELKDPSSLGAWLVAKGLMDSSQPVDESDLKHARAVREAMRGVIGGNNGHRVYPVEIATLNEAATASGLRMRFTADGQARLEPDAPGVVGALGRLVASLYAAMQDEDWVRLKLCGDDDCRWVFFDRSRNHSSRWCTMESCGNRAKARRFRQSKRSSLLVGKYRPQAEDGAQPA
jgi:predicted RNA-binding Zn ribbon-like protein